MANPEISELAMLKTAEIYGELAKHSNYIGQTTNIRYLLPSHVIAALCLEIYCKTTYFIINHKQAPRTHDFHALFINFPEGIKKKMITNFNEIINLRPLDFVVKTEEKLNIVIPRDLISNLKEWSSVFIEVRYLYDTPKKNTIMMFFEEIESVFRNEIFELMPELEQK